MEKNKLNELKEKIFLVKQVAGIEFYKPEQFSKCELARSQKKIHTLMTYALFTKDVVLVTACQKVAKEYVWQKGYAQKPSYYVLEQVQNIYPFNASELLEGDSE